MRNRPARQGRPGPKSGRWRTEPASYAASQGCGLRFRFGVNLP